MRKLLVDVQLFQTPAWHRGMGKYSLELLSALAKVLPAGEWDSMELLLSRQVKTEASVAPSITKRLPGVVVHELDLMPDEIGNARVPIHNRAVIDKFVSQLVSTGDEVDFLVMSAMQGGIYPTFPSVENVKKAVIFYDLIPLMFQDIYLRNSITRDEYLPRIGELLRADKYLAISKTVANDLATYLGVDESRVTSVDGGAIAHGTNAQTYKLDKPYIFMPTGNDLRKNNRRAILGFDAFNQQHDGKYSLVITSFFKPHEIAELSKLSADVVFTGNISGEEMTYLYEHATALLFPPEYEGLGMPILEALGHGKPIACSNIGVFREMSPSAFEYFDPYSVPEISAALARVVVDSGRDQSIYKEILSRYSWPQTAEKVIAAFQTIPVSSPVDRPSLTVVAPMPSKSSLGRLLQEDHAELTRHFQPTYYLEDAAGPEQRINYLSYIGKTYILGPGQALLAAPGLAVYHIPNHRYAARSYFAALARPGIVVLYGSDLSEVWGGLIAEGLVDEGRIAAEVDIETTYSEAGSAHIAGLLSSQQAVIVLDKAAEPTVKKVLAATRSAALLRTAALPVSSIIYATALPAKTTAVITEDPSEPIAADYQQFTQTAKAECEVFTEHVDEQTVLEAMRFGVLPCLPTNHFRLPEELVRLSGGNTPVDAVAVEPALRDALAGYVQHARSHGGFVAVLAEVVASLGGTHE